MTIAAALAIYDEFLKSFTPLLKVEDQKSYNKALTHVEQLMELSIGNDNGAYCPLIGALANAIERYESLDPDLNSFIERSKAVPADIAMLTTLMNQNGLSDSDFPEIGNRSMVSQILKGETLLSRSAIDALALRFGISSGRFFN